MGEGKTRKEKLLDIIKLAVEIDGAECRSGESCDKPEVDFNYYGMTAHLSIDVYPHGWSEGEKPQFRYDLYFDKELFSQDRYNRACAELRLLRDMGKDET